MKKILYSVMALAIAAMTFTACEDVPEPYPTPSGGNTPEEETIGTLEEPITVAKALELINGYSDGGSSTSQAYVKGVISQVQSYNSTYKSITYYISDDGSSTNQVQCYSGKGLNGADFSSKDDLKVGTAVIVKGKLKKFVNNSGATIQEIDQSSTIVWMGDVPETPAAEPKGTGTLEDPFNAAAANAEALKLAEGATSTASYYIKGKVAEIKYNYGEGKYPKSADYYISEDGSKNNMFYVYASKYLGNTDYESGTVLAVGNDVIVYGQLQNYNGTAETATNKSYLYSLNGKTEAEGGDTPQPTGNYGTAEKPLTVAKALDVIAELQMKGTTPEEAYVKGVVVSVESYNSQYKSLTYWISDDGTENGKMEVYSGKGLNGADFTATTDLHKGAVVVVKGILKKFQSGESYVPEFDKNSVIISITNNEGGNDNPTTPDTPSTGEGSYAQPFSVANVIAKGTANSTPNVYVKAYIVGWVEGQVLSTGAKFNSEGVTVDTNILIADAANEGDVTKCVPVQLPKGAIRTGLNLKENPGLLGKQVILYGNLEKYFGAAGIKSVSYAECNGNSIGTKP